MFLQLFSHHGSAELQEDETGVERTIANVRRRGSSSIQSTVAETPRLHAFKEDGATQTDELSRSGQDNGREKLNGGNVDD